MQIFQINFIGWGAFLWRFEKFAKMQQGKENREIFWR